MSDSNRSYQMRNQWNDKIKDNRQSLSFGNQEQNQAPKYFDAHDSNIKKTLNDDDIADLYIDHKQPSQGNHNYNSLLNQIKYPDQKHSNIQQSNDKKTYPSSHDFLRHTRTLFQLPQKDIITSHENPSMDSNNKRIPTSLSIHTNQNLTQTNINQFLVDPQKKFVQHNQDGSTSYLQKGFKKPVTAKTHQSTMEQLSQKPLIQVPVPVLQDEKKKSDKIYLNDLPDEERKKIFKELSKFDREKKCSSQVAEKERERKKLELLDDLKLKEKGKQQAEELLNEGKSSLFSSIKIEKRKTIESKRLSNFKMMMEAKNGEQTVGKPVFEYNRLLKYLFLKNYFTPDIQDQECKVIPNKFESGDEYSKIFEYLFLNEASAQLKQEVNEFVKKYSKNNKYRKIQIKIDETEYDKDGTIFNIRGPQQEQQSGEVENTKEEYTTDYTKLKDGQCDLTQLKNYIVIISSKFQLKISRINSIKGEEMLFFGILIDPQKAQFLHQIKLQSFIDCSKLNPQSWYNVILFPFAKITTLIREYQMITQLQYRTPLSSLIYNPTHQQHLIGSDLGGVWTAQFENVIPNKQVVAQFFDLLECRYNQSQAKSIQEIILKDKGICLLQGPPGTGKTHTLIGLLSGVYEYMYQMNKFPKKKILICAPSNAAIDEIIVRIIQKGGLFDSSGNFRQAKVIRMGLLDEESENCELIKKVSLEDLAQHKLFQTEKQNASQDQKTTADLRIEICQIFNQSKKIEKKLKTPGITNEVRSALNIELEQCIELRRVKQNYLDRIRQNKKLYKESYTMMCEKLLNDAEIICSTLSSSGSDKLTRFADQIELLIVDEAAQCTEPSNIIPLRLGIKKMILIGDPRQLPATTFSSVSSQTLYNRSLFERILDNNFQPFFLDTQYRMHSEIRTFPSLYFYQNKLKDHESTNKRVIPKDYFEKRTLFLDIKDGQEQREGTSYINDREANVIVDLIKNIKDTFMTQTIGVICSYKSQVKHIKQQLKVAFPDELALQNTMLSVNTVDSFQGQEKDIILFSCVRSSESGGIGFLNDGRRMNVALTRAKNALFIIGNAITLSKSDLWRQLLLNLNQRNLYRSLENHQEFDFQKIVKDDWPVQNTKISNHLIKILSQSNQSLKQKITYNISDFTIDGTQFYTENNEQDVYKNIEKGRKETDKKQHHYEKKKIVQQIEIEKPKNETQTSYPTYDGCYEDFSFLDQLKLEGFIQ